MDYQKVQQKFISSGIDIAHPVDIKPPGKFSFLENVRSYQEGSLTSRVGISRVNGSPLADLNLHTIGQLNDYVTSIFVNFIAAGTNLYRNFTNVDSGYDGNPVSFCSYRPEQSPNNYMYVANGGKMAKIPSSGSAKRMGVLPPTDIPSAQLVAPARQFDVQTEDSSLAWSTHGVASAFAFTQRLTGVFVGDIIAEAGAGGYQTFVSPTGGDYQNISPGMKIYFDRGGPNNDGLTVEEVHKINGDPGVIAAISYDDVGAGAPYLVTVQPSLPVSGMARNAILFLDTELVRIISVTNSPEGLTSFRCIVQNIHTAGETLTAPASGNFYVFSFMTHAPGESLTSVQLDFTVTPGATPGAAASVSYNYSPNVLNLGFAGSRPIGPDDYIHLSFKVDDPSAIVEAKLVIDTEVTTTNTYNAADGTKNGYIKTFRPNDFQAIIQNLQPADIARQRAIQLQLQGNTQIDLQSSVSPLPPYGAQGSTPIDTPIVAASSPAITPSVSSTSQSTLGNSQWTEFFWKIADLIRMGSAQLSDLSDIRAVQLQITANSTVHISFANLWVGGTYGPDTNIQLTPLIYRCRYRDSTTGAKSIPGPAMRTGINAMRQGILLDMISSTDPQVDKIDVERLGADLLEWHYVGTCDNNNPTFTDDQFSASVLINPALETDTYTPFPLEGVPFTAVVNVIGTAIEWVSGTAFDTRWARGTVVLVNGKVTSIYATPTSTTLFHIADSLGSTSSATLIISAPILQGQPLPVMWGPWNETLFGCGTSLDVGTVYFTKGSDPDSAPLANYVEVTTPNEVMMNGCLYDSRNFAFSDKRMFYILAGGINQFQFQEVANSKGLFARWALTVGPKIWFLSQDGIYESDGGTPVCITDDISPLFPSGDRPGFATGGLFPVQMDNPGSGTQQENLRLTYNNGFVFFDYVDTNGQGRCLVYDTFGKGWYPDKYNISGRLICHYQQNSLQDNDEHFNLYAGGSDGYLYIHQGFSDNNSNIQCSVRTPSYDTGDFRALKVWADYIIDMEMAGVNLVSTPYINDYATALPAITVTNTTRNISSPIDISTGTGSFGRNLGLQLTWASNTSRPILYAWTPSVLVRPDDTFRRADDWDDAGYGGAKLVRGFLIEADTESIVKGFNLEGDQATLTTYSQTFSGQRLLPFTVSPPVIASLLRIHPTSDVVWRKFRVSYIYDKYPENAAIQTPYTNEGTSGAKFVQGALVTALGLDSSAQVKYDGGINGPVMNLQHIGSVLSTKPYSFETPFIAHELALAPSTAIRIDAVKWVWEPMPEAAQYWKTQGTSHGINGWQFLKDGYIAYISSAPCTLIINVDGTDFTYSLPSTGGVYSKVYLIFSKFSNSNTGPKGKIFTYSLIGNDASLRLFKKDCEVRVHQWGGNGYQIFRPFGGASYSDGASI